MGKSAPSPPPAPDQQAIIAQQGANNKETALLQGRLSNPAFESTPFGTLTNQVADDGTLTRTTRLHPQEQANLDLQRQITGSVNRGSLDLSGNIRNTISTPIEDSFRNLPELTSDISSGIDPIQRNVSSQGLPTLTGSNDFSADADRIRNSVFESGNRLLSPLLDKRRESLEGDLINRGFTRGTEGFKGSVLDFENFERNPAIQGLIDQSIQAGGAEQNRLFGLDSTARSQLLGERQSLAGFANAARGQGISENAAIAGQAQNVRNQLIQESLQQRNQPLNELAVLLGSSPGVQTGSFSGLTPTAVNPTDVLGAFALNQQGQQNNFNQANAVNASQLGGMTSLASAGITAAALSSRRFKDTKKPMTGVLEKIEHMDVDRWTYNEAVPFDNKEHVGPYAEDFKEAFGVGDGVEINFVDAIGVLFAGIKELAVEIREMKEAK